MAEPVSTNNHNSLPRRLAEQLIAHEAAIPCSSGQDALPVARVYNGLRRAVGSLAGVNGFRILAARSLGLATARASRLNAVRVEADGSLSGMAPDIHRYPADGIVLIAQLLDLLAAFIGGGLTLQIVLNVWPDFTIPPTEPSEEIGI